MDTTERTDQLLWRAFCDLPTWQKGTIAFLAVITSPLWVFLAIIAGLSLWPLFLLGRFEGNLGKRPLERDLSRAVHRHLVRTEHYYGGT
jgi:hypothetical protein